MRYQKTPLRFEIKLLPVALDSHSSTQRNKKDGVVCCVALTGTKRLQWKFTLERIYDLNAPRSKRGGCAAGNMMAQKSKNARENDHGNARETNTRGI